MTPELRRWVYRCAIAAVPVLVYYGLLSPTAVPLLLPLILALLNVNDES